MLTVGILSFLQAALVPAEVGLVVDHEAAALHSDGAALFESAPQLGTVLVALKLSPTEVPFLVEDDLEMENIVLLFRNRFLSIVVNDHAVKLRIKSELVLGISNSIFLDLL